tara:strand:- start:140 stop:256 length:117 start_codon:yes stop_codon:yes gene_type:complete
MAGVAVVARVEAVIGTLQEALIPVVAQVTMVAVIQKAS